MLRLSLALIVVLTIIRPSYATCYQRNGTEISSQDYQPCTSSAGATSMCCATSRLNADLCLPSGLCVGGADTAGGRLFWRESCTDPTWQDPACLKICDQGGEFDHLCGAIVYCIVKISQA